jgi:hypothetical protein
VRSVIEHRALPFNPHGLRWRRISRREKMPQRRTKRETGAN